MPLLAFTLMVAYLPGLPSAPVDGRWLIPAIMGAILFRRLSIEWSFGHVIGVAFLIHCIASLFWTSTVLGSVQELLHLAMLACVFCLCAECTDFRPIAKGLIAGLAVSLPFAILQWFGIQLVQTVSFSEPTIWSHDATPVSVGLFLSTTMFVEVSALCLILAVGFRFTWPWAMIPTLCLFLGLSRNSGREGVLIVLTALWFYLLISLKGWSSRLTLVVSTLGLPFAAWYWDLFQYFDYGHLTAIDDRLEIWEGTYRSITRLGYGLGSYPTLFRGYGLAHNDFLQLAFEVGPIGLMLFAGLLLHAFSAPGAIAIRSALAGWVGAALVYDPLHMPASAYMGAMFAGWLCGSAHWSRYLRFVGGRADQIRVGSSPASATPANL